MSKREVHIISYFSVPTDLAAELRSLPGFSSGQGYEVRLSSPSEEVDIGLVDSGEEKYVFVRGSGVGDLYYRALGRAIHALAAHSDNLMVDRVA